MKKVLILSLVALAAFSLPAAASDVNAPYAKAAPVYGPTNWSGFYVGGNVGAGFGNVTTTDINGGVPPGPFGYTTTGVLGGAQGGFNYQWNSIVASLEVDLGYLGANGKGYVPSSTPGHHQDLTLSGGFTAGVSGRLGYAIGRWLPYVKGGYVYYDGNAAQTTTKAGYATTPTGAYSGYAIGGGVEYALMSDWSIKVEYLRYELGSQGGMQTSLTDPPIGYQYKNSTSVNFDTIKFGVNYHF